jgi:hypothetical protein
MAARQLGLESDADSSGSMQAAELKMREALGLNGRGDRPPPRPQTDQPRTNGERSSNDRPAPNGHRHRFVQDGEVPVVLAKNNGLGNGASTARGAGAPPTANRLASLSAELGLERSARERAERTVQQLQAVARDLQTKLAHAELARAEAVAASRADHAALAALRVANREQIEQIEATLRAERAARQTAEAALQARLAAPPPPPVLAPAPAAPRVAKAKKAAAPRKPREPKVREPKPVRWWIRSESSAKT